MFELEMVKGGFLSHRGSDTSQGGWVFGCPFAVYLLDNQVAVPMHEKVGDTNFSIEVKFLFVLLCFILNFIL
jgi:hypothetical protein